MEAVLIAKKYNSHTVFAVHGRLASSNGIIRKSLKRHQKKEVIPCCAFSQKVAMSLWATRNMPPTVVYYAAVAFQYIFETTV